MPIKPAAKATDSQRSWSAHRHEEYFHVPDLEAHNINEIPDRQKTAQQHDHLKSVMAQSGAEVIDVTELSGHPNSVFTRDIALSTPKGYVELRMGLESRRGEESWMARILESMGEPRAGTIQEPGTVEGGDILLAEEVAFVGVSKRTNPTGVEQISEILKGMDYEVRVLPVPDGYLHLGGAMSVIAPDRIVCCRSEFDPSLLRTVSTSSMFQSEVPPRAMSSAWHQMRSWETLRKTKRPSTSSTTTGSTFILSIYQSSEKAQGGPTCLILPVERNSHPQARR